MNNEDGYYIQLFSIHGLIRHENLEMGRDADTGGQVKYVLELAEHLARLPIVRKVDLVTRLIDDKRVSEDYAEPVTLVNDKFRIVRIRCGGKRYIRKELLWPHLQEFVDKTIKFIKQENEIPDIVHGHYADAGYVARELSQIFGLPFIFTGHSLGREKLHKLLNDGMKEEDVIKKYKINTRIQSEEEILTSADLIVTSTRQEIDRQYAIYEKGNYPQFKVIPPGIDIEKFYPYYHDLMSDFIRDEIQMHAQASVIGELNRFFMQPDRPLILALCRPDKRKNIVGLIEAYGKDYELQAIANLAIFAGIRKDIDAKEENERDVLTQMLLEMDKYDLYGKMAIPKKHNFEYEVPELYRIAAASKGVFVNAALTEPFGLTLLEAAACGVPIVATNDGGPQDIIKNCSNGILVDPTSTKDIAKAIKKILVQKDVWNDFSMNGIFNVRKHYTWDSHAESYSAELKKIMNKRKTVNINDSYMKNKIGKRLTELKYFLITDIDNTLIGENNGGLDELKKFLQDNKSRIGFAVATGRTIDSTVKYLKQHKVPLPDVIIPSVGSEIYYGEELIYDRGWDAHLSHRWERDKIVNSLEPVKNILYQEDETQRKFKVSYYMGPKSEKIHEIGEILLSQKLKYNLIYSHDQYLDILPYRGSKGKAVRYLSYKWEIPLENIIVCGDSGNDEEMLKGETMAIVVGNHSHELDKLRGHRKIYFAEGECASGIVEGLHYYDIINKINC